MSDTLSLKIAVVGDFNFAFNTHHATNMALDHAQDFLEIELSYYWLKTSEFLTLRASQLSNYDGFWVAPGPYLNDFYVNGVIDVLSQQKKPVLITGDGFRALLEVLIRQNNLNRHGEKLVSENLVGGNQFERIHIKPESKAMEKLYFGRNTIELAATRFSMYPNLIEILRSEVIDIEAQNQYEEPEVISLKKHAFFVASGFCPQVSSTRDMPHPLVYTFLKACSLQPSQTG